MFFSRSRHPLQFPHFPPPNRIHRHQQPDFQCCQRLEAQKLLLLQDIVALQTSKLVNQCNQNDEQSSWDWTGVLKLLIDQFGKENFDSFHDIVNVHWGSLFEDNTHL